MDRRRFMSTAGALVLGLGAANAAGPMATTVLAAGQPQPPTPAMGGKTLAEALRLRQSQRAYSPEPLAEALLLELLWAACGVNRSDGRRTAPSARNRQEVQVYCAKADGLFLYDAQAQALKKLSGADLRAQTGTQGYAATAPVNLLFVADMDKVAGDTAEEKLLHAGLDTGFISQNVYLFCAAAGLATVARTSLDAPALAKAMGLAARQRVLMAQCVGHPKA